MNFIKRINIGGWVSLAVALLLGLRYVIPGLNQLVGDPSHATETTLVVVAAFCFGFFGINPKK